MPDTAELISIGMISLPVQIFCEEIDGTASGVGFTRTVTMMGAPGQPLATGVTVNVTITGIFELFTRLPVMLPLPLVAMLPVTPGLSRTQLKVVPLTEPVN